MRLRVEPIKPRSNLLDPKKFELAVENFLDAAAENIRIDLEVTSQTWKRKPKFIILKKKGERQVYTDSAIYKFVSGGTRVRYATMTPGFVAKTTPGVIGSGQGRGGVLYINRRRPRPGIKAREFPKVIIRKWSPRWPILYSQMQRAAL